MLLDAENFIKQNKKFSLKQNKTRSAHNIMTEVGDMDRWNSFFKLFVFLAKTFFHSFGDIEKKQKQSEKNQKMNLIVDFVFNYLFCFGFFYQIVSNFSINIFFSLPTILLEKRTINSSNILRNNLYFVLSNCNPIGSWKVKSKEKAL